MGKTVRNESLYDDFDDNSYNYRGTKAQVKKKTNTFDRFESDRHIRARRNL